MAHFISQIRPYAEFLYFVASILLLISVGLTYRQLAWIKKDIRTKNQRAAAEKAIEACSQYLAECTLTFSQTFQERKQANLESYKGPIGDFSFESIPPALLGDCIKRFQLSSWLALMNRLESISSYFITGVADEKTGFRVIGRTFCYSVEVYYDHIALSRREKVHGYWTNVVELYQLWRPRLTKAELDFEKDALDKRILALPNSCIPPIGLDG